MAIPPTLTKDDIVGESEKAEHFPQHGMEIVVFNQEMNNNQTIKDDGRTIRANDWSTRDDERSTRGVRKIPWTQGDEKMLAKAWLYVSGNSGTKDSQPIKNFWRQVFHQV